MRYLSEMLLIFWIGGMATAVQGKSVTLSSFQLKEAFRKLKPDIYARFDKDSWTMTDPSPVGYLSVIQASDDSSECTSHILHTF